jgi:hypothetical protein
MNRRICPSSPSTSSAPYSASWVDPGISEAVERQTRAMRELSRPAEVVEKEAVAPVDPSNLRPDAIRGSGTLLLVPHVIAAGALRYQPRRPAGTISTKGNGV